MKKLFYKLFGRKIFFGYNTANFVNVVNSNKKDDDVFSGVIKSVDFDKRLVFIEESMYITNGKNIIHCIPFGRIVTVGRMRDGRLRMWIKEG